MYPLETYGKTYEQWVKERAERIHGYLSLCYATNRGVDIQELAYRLYFERLSMLPFWKWQPINDRFLDRKPSSFIKNFLNYLIRELKEGGYLITTAQAPTYEWFQAEFNRFIARLAEGGFLREFKLGPTPPYSWFKETFNDFFTKLREAGYLKEAAVGMPSYGWLLDRFNDFIERLIGAGYLKEAEVEPPPYGFLLNEFDYFIRLLEKDGFLRLVVASLPSLQWLEKEIEWKPD